MHPWYNGYSRTWTYDPSVNSRMLYRLSYVSVMLQTWRLGLEPRLMVLETIVLPITPPTRITRIYHGLPRDTLCVGFLIPYPQSLRVGYYATCPLGESLYEYSQIGLLQLGLEPRKTHYKCAVIPFHHCSPLLTQTFTVNCMKFIGHHPI